MTNEEIEALRELAQQSADFQYVPLDESFGFLDPNPFQGEGFNGEIEKKNGLLLAQGKNAIIALINEINFLKSQIP